jgi:predicted GNAT superfamily acetyltransferase
MTITIRPFQTLDEYAAAEQLQAEVWGMTGGVEVVPTHLLLTAQMHGGLVLGAFDDAAGERLVGFVFGFAGLLPDGSVKHCSHMAAVAPDCRDRHIGYRLKLAQRERVLAQGIRLIVWTYDPLEPRNANLNLHKLGGVVRKYYRNLYGELSEALSAGLPTDRLQVEWHVAGAHVAAALDGTRPHLAPAELRAAGAVVVDGPQPGAGERVLPHLAGQRLLLAVPADFQAIKAADPGLARAWRTHTRAVFEAAFASGYAATDLLMEGEARFYLLEK